MVGKVAQVVLETTTELRSELVTNEREVFSRKRIASAILGFSFLRPTRWAAPMTIFSIFSAPNLRACVRLKSFCHSTLSAPMKVPLAAANR